MLEHSAVIALVVVFCFLTEGTCEQEVADVIVKGDATRTASVGRPSTLTIQLIDSKGRNVSSSKDILKRLVVSTAPAPLSGTIEDRGGGCFHVMIVHEWVTISAPEHGLTNVSVLLDGRHVGGSPFVYGTQHQFWVRPRNGTKEKELKANQRTASGKLPGAFVTLVATDEFALGTLVLAYSLTKVGSKFPFIAMITSKVSKHVHSMFRHAGIVVKDVDAVSNPFASFKQKLEEKSWEQVYTKMQAWTLVEYERVVFLDADQLVVQNIDELMQWPLTQNFAAIPDVAPPIFFNRLGRQEGMGGGTRAESDWDRERRSSQVVEEREIQKEEQEVKEEEDRGRSRSSV
mmetsp:Transcript_45675/g.143373  ORF Transcript_45675/g.143373 Transcript_45675/m.143373 type:complete len:345 (-) Transcript_45675:13-1047(-)